MDTTETHKHLCKCPYHQENPCMCAYCTKLRELTPKPKCINLSCLDEATHSLRFLSIHTGEPIGMAHSYCLACAEATQRANNHQPSIITEKKGR